VGVRGGVRVKGPGPSSVDGPLLAGRPSGVGEGWVEESLREILVGLPGIAELRDIDRHRASLEPHLPRLLEKAENTDIAEHLHEILDSVL